MKKVLAIMLVCFMLVSLLPMGALAAEVEQETPACKGTTHYKDMCKATKYEDVPGKCGGYSYTVYTCDACGDYFAADFVKVDGEHVFKETKAPTCEDKGEQVCEVCDYKESIDALGHKAAGDATCTEASVCERCGEEIEPNTAHNFGEKPSAIVKEPDEEKGENGLAEYTCEDCGTKKEVVILTHQCSNFFVSFTVNNGKIEILGVAPTCTEPGMKPHGVCNDCGRYWILEFANNSFVPVEEVTKDELIIPALGHTGAEEFVTAMPVEGNESDEIYLTGLVGTYTFGFEGSAYLDLWCQAGEDGEWDNPAWVYGGETTEYTFLEGYTYCFVFGGDGVAYIPQVVTEIVTPGNCQQKETTERKCSVCGEQYITEKEDFDHVWAVEYKTEPTCQKYGFIIESCVVCGENSITRLEKLNHTFPEQVKDTKRVAPGCTSDGYLQWFCTECGEEQRHVLPATGCQIVTVTVPATCKSEGYFYTYCANDANGDKSCPNHDYMQHSSYHGDMFGSTEGRVALCVIEYGVLPVDENAHNANDIKNADKIPATHTEDGIIAYWCTDCGTAIREVLPALGHTWAEELFEVAPSCDAPGFIYKRCTDDACVDLGKMEGIEILEWIEFTPEYTYTDVDAAREGHKLTGEMKEFRKGVCGKTSALYGYFCENCKNYIMVEDTSFLSHVEPENLPVVDIADCVTMTLKNTFADRNAAYNGDYVNITAPDFDGVVIVLKGASVKFSFGGSFTAGDEWTRKNIWISKTDFDAGVTSYEVTLVFIPSTTFAGVDATCTTAGFTAQYECERCQATVAATVISAAGHNKVDVIEHQDATCTAPGRTEGWTCETCGEVQESKVIPTLRHDLEMTDSAEWKDGEQYGYEHYECVNCDYECIQNYVPFCDHDYKFDRFNENNVKATCTAGGIQIHICSKCNKVKEVETERVHHKNAAGQDLEFCGTETEDKFCATEGCDFVGVPEHDLNEGLAYKANCQTNAYIIRTCQTKGCTHYEVTEIEGTRDENAHVWSDWADVIDKETGVVIAEGRGCQVCGIEEHRAISEIAYSATIENKANAEMGISDGTMIKVTISVSGAEDNMWGFHLNVDFSENLIFVGHNFVTENFTYAQIATEHEGYITILANADGDVTLDGQEDIVELYFEVVAPEATEIWVNFSKYETLKAEAAEGETNAVAARAYGASAETVELMELDGFEGITLADALALYNLIAENDNTNVAADLDKDGAVTLADYLYLYSYIAGEMSYEQIVALRSIICEG